MRRSLLAVPALALALSGSIAAKDPPRAPYPAGTSTQRFGERSFEIVVPANPPPAQGYALLIAVDGEGHSLAADYAGLAADGFVVCCPSKLHGGSGWAANEAGDLAELAQHLATVLPLEKDRLHVLTNESWGFGSFVAFHKDVHAASLCLDNSNTYRGKSPPDSAKKQTAVLAFASTDPRFHADASVLKPLAGKVRTLEWRAGTALDPYYRYWLLVADGRFTPGEDLSFAWRETLDAARQEAEASKRGAFVYLWSKADASKPEAKALQNDVFFRQDVRDAGARLVAVKVEREPNEKAFAAWGRKTTPAVVVLDATFTPLASFEGAVDGTALLAALKKAAPDAKKGK